MDSYQVFLSYASKDKLAVEEIARCLKARGITLFLDEWDLIPGTPVQEHLEKALDQSDSCAVFIGTHGIGPWQNEELRSMLEDQVDGRPVRVIPVLLPGAPDWEQIKADVPRFLRRRAKVEFRASLDDGVSLDQFIAGIRGSARGASKHRRSGEPGRLTVEIRLDGEHLSRRYLGPYGPLVADRRDPWIPFRDRFKRWYRFGADAVQDDDLGQAMFDLLFQDQRDYFHQDVLAEVFPNDKTRSAPGRHPLRLRLHLNTPDLTNLPWGCLSWEGRNLAMLDWSLELATPGNAGVTWPGLQVRLHTPCAVLIIAPEQQRLGAANHAKAVKYKFKDLWLGAEIRTATNRAEINAAIRERYPRIVYVHGAARQEDNRLSLLLDDGAMDLATLGRIWQQNPPQILFLNLLEESGLTPNWAVRDLAGDIPLVAVQHWPLDDIQTPRDAILGWLHELLTSDDPLMEPVGFLHRHAPCTAVAWTGYGGWKTDTVDRSHPSARKPLAKLLLDRDDQRGQALQALFELSNDRNRRMGCLLCYGGPGNLAERFGEQLFAYLEQQIVGSRLHLQRITLDLPSGNDFAQRDVNREIRERFDLRPDDALGRALDACKQLLPGNPMTVLLLDWQVRDLDNPGLQSQALYEWLDYCRDRLTACCPEDMRLLGCLTLEAPLERHDDLADLFKSLGEDTALLADTFQLELLDPLHNVERSHLAKYLASSDCKCPQELQSLMSDLILKKTQGQFDATADLIDEAEELGWWGLRDRLVKTFGEPGAQPAPSRPRGNRRL